MNASYVLLAFAAMMAVTFALRALPFVATEWLRRHAFVQRLKDFLPLAIMTLLLLHSGRQAASLGATAAVAATLITVILQWLFRHALLSIGCGTTLFVLLVRYGS